MAGNLSGYRFSLTIFAHEVYVSLEKGTYYLYFTYILFIVLGNHMITEG